MSATEAVLGYHTFLYRADDTSPSMFVKIAEVRNISAFGSKRGLVEVTHLDSPNSAKEFISTLKDGVEFTAMCNMLMDTTQEDLIADHDAATAHAFRIETPNQGTSDQFDFDALVLGWEFGADPNNPLEMSFSFKVTGPITIS